MATVSASPLANYRVIRRDGQASSFDPAKISLALFLAVESTAASASRRIHETVEELTAQVVAALTRRTDGERLLHIEDVQDQVELVLMRAGHHKVARGYALYSEERSRQRETAAPAPRASWTETLREAGSTQSRMGGTKDWNLSRFLPLKPDLLILDREDDPRFMTEDSSCLIGVTRSRTCPGPPAFVRCAFSRAPVP
ncbi:MAG: hypothetical protein KIS61_09240 [Candidatus Eremiobacteraeota bacterium]|nr:hypothetical protein [Candidatus Eremiobacteraeota bacterium]